MERQSDLALVPYRCRFCTDRSFSIRSLLERHLSQVHSLCSCKQCLLRQETAAFTLWSQREKFAWHAVATSSNLIETSIDVEEPARDQDDITTIRDETEAPESSPAAPIAKNGVIKRRRTKRTTVQRPLATSDITKASREKRAADDIVAHARAPSVNGECKLPLRKVNVLDVPSPKRATIFLKRARPPTPEPARASGSFECHECGHVAKTEIVMRLHKGHHAGWKPFRCEVCQEGFYSADQVVEHAKARRHENPSQPKFHVPGSLLD